MEEELWIARHDYSKERDDVLSFDKGTRFKVMSRSNAEWWAVKNVDTQEVGYVPSSYLEVIDKSAGACESNEDGEQPVSDRQDIREKIMQLAQRKEPPTGKAVTEPSEDEVVQVVPKKVPHPTSSSTSHKKLHKELQLSNKLGGAKQLGKPELQKVMDRRRPDSDGRSGTITGKPRKEDNLGDKELSSRLRQQSEKLASIFKVDMLHHYGWMPLHQSYMKSRDFQANQVKEVESRKPEFMKMSLNKFEPNAESGTN